MPITFERNICCNLDETISHEWLLTNGQGGYAAGTISGTLTRLQQGLLVAALDEKIAPQLLVAKIDEEVLFDQRTYYLGTNEYQDGTLNPAGFVHLESFRLEEGMPIFTYRLGGINGVMLEKRIWMPQDQNTTFIQYRVLRISTGRQNAGSAVASWRNGGRPEYNGYARSYQYAESAQSSLTLTLLPFVAYRPYDQPQYGDHNRHFQITNHQSETDGESWGASSTFAQGMAGCTIRAHEEALPYHILAIGHPESQTQFIPTGVWYWHFLRRHSQTAGLPSTDDLYLPGVVRTRFWPDKDTTLTIIMTAEDPASQPQNQSQLHRSYEQALDYQRSRLQAQRYFGEGGGSVQTLPVLPFHEAGDVTIKNEEFLSLLHQAGDRLLVRYPPSHQERLDNWTFLFNSADQAPRIIQGYYQLANSTRETLIALPGLAIATRRYSEAQRILRHLGHHFRSGLLPEQMPSNYLPRLNDAAYASADISLWYFYALDKYLSATHDYNLLNEVYMSLADCISCYTQGTSQGIQVDPADGLLRAGTGERPLTWMNAQIDDQPVTPRAGKAVEVNALWYHALCLMHEWSHQLYQQGRISYTPQHYIELGQTCQRGFNQRFWNPNSGYLYDLIDGKDGHDGRLRPNQLLAISLRHSVLDDDRQAAVLGVIEQHLLTPYGLRTLAPGEQDYRGELPEQHTEYQRALHQGAAWPWLIGPYVDALLRVGDQGGSSQREGMHRTINADLYKKHAWLKGLQTLEPFRHHMQQNMLGAISSVYSGNFPHTSGLQVASAISIGELLRAYKVLTHMGVQHFDQVISA